WLEFFSKISYNILSCHGKSMFFFYSLKIFRLYIKTYIKNYANHLIRIKFITTYHCDLRHRLIMLPFLGHWFFKIFLEDLLQYSQLFLEDLLQYSQLFLEDLLQILS